MKYFLGIVLFFTIWISSAQTGTENYIYTRTYQQEFTEPPETVTAEEAIEDVSYFDGLGRSKQIIDIRAGGNKEDIVTPVIYDDYGRQVMEYLPFAISGAGGSIFIDPLASETNFYNTAKYENTLNPYSEKELEASPLSRILKQAAPGEDWKLGSGHEIDFNNQANTADEVRLFEVEFIQGDTGQPVLIGENTEFYEVGELYKAITKDEQHSGSSKNHTTEEFKDKEGLVVLKRTYADTPGESEAPFDTYYVYDDYGNLTYVLPPKMEAGTAALSMLNSQLADLGYQYKYDDRDRLIEKKIPGKGWEYIVYNTLDQPVLTQDANLKKENSGETKDKWLFTKYDAFGRVAYTGYIEDDTSRIDLQLSMNGASDQYEHRENPSFSVQENPVYYSNGANPQSLTDIYTINYYDDYNNIDVGFTIPLTNTYGKSIVQGIKTKGLATVTKVRVLETDDWITTAIGYDDKGRVIWTKTTNPNLGTTDVVENELDFVGNVKNSLSTHTVDGNTIEVRDTYEYDHMNRMTLHPNHKWRR